MTLCAADAGGDGLGHIPQAVLSRQNVFAFCSSPSLSLSVFPSASRCVALSLREIPVFFLVCCSLLFLSLSLSPLLLLLLLLISTSGV